MNVNGSSENSSPQKVSQSDDRMKPGIKASSSTAVKPRLIANYDPMRQEEIRRANRVAAMECRKRKKMLTQNLEITLENVKNENQTLKGQYNALAAMVGQLKFQRMCQTTQNQQIQPQASNMISQTPIVSSDSTRQNSNAPTAEGGSQKANAYVQNNDSSQSSSFNTTIASSSNPNSQTIHQQPLFQFAPTNMIDNHVIHNHTNPPSIFNMMQNPIFGTNMQQSTVPMPYIDPFWLQRMQLQLQEQMAIQNLYSNLANIGNKMNGQMNNLQMGGFMPMSVQGMPLQNQVLPSFQQVLTDDKKQAPTSNDDE